MLSITALARLALGAAATSYAQTLSPQSPQAAKGPGEAAEKSPEVLDPDLAKLANLHVRFSYGDGKIQPSAVPVLDAVVEIMKRRTDIRRLRIEGHSDPIGGLAFNEQITSQRAQLATAYLLENGIDPGRLTAVGWASRCPRFPYFTPDSSARNRRVDFVPLEVTGKRLPPPRCTQGMPAPAAYGLLIVKVYPAGAALDFTSLTRLVAGEVASDPDGAAMTFTDVLEPGTGELRVTLGGYKAQTVALAIAAGQTVHREIRLLRDDVPGGTKGTTAAPAHPPKPAKALDPDLYGGPQATWEGADPAMLDTKVSGAVSWPEGRRTKWWSLGRLPFDSNNFLECTLYIDKIEADLNIDIMAVGRSPSRIGFSPGPTPDRLKRLAVRLESSGSYFIRIQAAQPRDESRFSWLCNIGSEPQPAWPPPPISENE